MTTIRWKAIREESPELASYGAITRIRKPEDAAKIIASLIEDEPQECFVVMSLSTRMNVAGLHVLYRGMVDGLGVRIAEVFRAGILTNATALIVAHNHPSGDLAPSPEDIRLTQNLIDAGKLLDMKVEDHLIIGEGGAYTSLRERGFGNW